MAVAETEMTAYRQAVVTPTAEVAADLVAHVPLGTLAQIAGVKETRALHQWAAGAREPRGPQELRLRIAHHLTSLVDMPDRPWVTGAWFLAPIPGEGDGASPLSLLRELPEDEAGRAGVMRTLVGAALLLREHTQ